MKYVVIDENVLQRAQDLKDPSRTPDRSCLTFLEQFKMDRDLKCILTDSIRSEFNSFINSLSRANMPFVRLIKSVFDQGEYLYDESNLDNIPECVDSDDHLWIKAQLLATKLFNVIAPVITYDLNLYDCLADFTNFESQLIWEYILEQEGWAHHLKEVNDFSTRDGGKRKWFRESIN